jgi:hypothetical protein
MRGERAKEAATVAPNRRARSAAEPPAKPVVEATAVATAGRRPCTR